MESFNSFLNSIPTVSSSQSQLFVNSIPRQPIQKTIQKTISEPPPTIDPFHVILPSMPVPTLTSPQNSTLLKKKRNHSSSAKPGAPSSENPRSLRPLLTSTLTSSKLPPVFDPFQNSILPSKPIPDLQRSHNSTLPTLKPFPTSTLPPPALEPSPNSTFNISRLPVPSTLPSLQPSISSALPPIRPFPTSTLHTSAFEPSPNSTLPTLKPPLPTALHTIQPFSTSTLPNERETLPSLANPRNARKQPVKRRNPSLLANPPILSARKVKKLRREGCARTLEAINFAIGLLEDEFKLRETASQEFPPEITSSHIRTAISKYEDDMSNALKKSVCSCCGRFIATADIYKVGDSDDILLSLQYDLDPCGHNENFWDFCPLCYGALQRDNIPKFSTENFVNITICQDYPSQLEDLTPVEECLIAKCHPVGTILKLRPGNHSAPTNYFALRGHMIVIPQDPGPLLQILPNPELRLDNLIKVFWLGKCKPTNQDLKPFLQVWKDKVLAALQYLVQNNHLYHDLAINHSMIESWPADFIPPEITNNITCLESPDHHEREGYTVSLEGGNYENDFHAAQDSAFQSNDHDPFVTGSIYTDANGERINPNIQMIDALLGVITGNTCDADEETPTVDDISDRHQCRKRNIQIISYAIRGQATLMSSWENPHYFTGAFPTLFPTGLGGHLEQRPVPVSLASFANWALNHHSRRHVFLFNLII